MKFCYILDKYTSLTSYRIKKKTKKKPMLTSIVLCLGFIVSRSLITKNVYTGTIHSFFFFFFVRPHTPQPQLNAKTFSFSLQFQGLITLGWYGYRFVWYYFYLCPRELPIDECHAEKYHYEQCK